MIDTAALNAQIDMRATAEQAGAKFKGNRSHCPIHGGDNPTAFEIFDNGRAWTCHTHGAECNRYGHDSIALLRALNNWTFQEAVAQFDKPTDPKEAQKRAEENAKRIERELKETIEKAQKALEDLQKARKWIEYHSNMNTTNRAMWEARGIPAEWQDFWKLGYCPSCPTYRKSDSLTIPIYTPNQDDPLMIRHRLLKPNPDNPKDKYRPEIAGLPAALCYADTTLPMDAADIIVGVEGEVKSFVTFLTIEKPLVQVMGIPGKEALKLFMNAMRGHDNFWLFPDPGSDWKERTAGTAARVVCLPDKIDDMINSKIIGRREIYGMMNQARRN